MPAATEIDILEGPPAEEKRGRGRPPGSKNKPDEAKPITNDRVDNSIASTLRLMHTTAAGLTGVPELQLTDEEAEEIAKAWREVLKAYGRTHWVKDLVLAPALDVTMRIELRKYQAFDQAMRERKTQHRPAEPAFDPTPNGSQQLTPEEAAIREQLASGDFLG